MARRVKARAAVWRYAEREKGAARLEPYDVREGEKMDGNAGLSI